MQYAARLFALALVSSAAFSAPAEAKDPDTEITIREGPSQIQPDEQVLAADPGRSIEHAIVILTETEQNDDFGMGARLEHHFRARILSNEGRSLADVEIPFTKGKTLLKTWWGKVLLPDGTVLKLKESELREKTLAATSGWERKILYGVLPGVVPGAVIDYGYTLDNDFYYTMFSAPLQSRFHTKTMRFRWVPHRGRTSAYRVKRADKLSIEVKRNDTSVLLSGRDLPPFVSEPFMPPTDESAGRITFYYPFERYGTTDFWNAAAKDVELGTTATVKSLKDIDKLIAAAGLEGSQAPLRERIERLYDWMRTNIRNPTFLTHAEQDERAAGEEEEKPESVSDVLSRQEAPGWFLRMLFVAGVRKLGGEAHELLVTDRTDHFWDRSLLTLRQFDVRLVAFKLPDEPDEKYTVVAPSYPFAFGELPWWVTASDGLLATADGMRRVFVKPPEARTTLSESSARVAFEEDPAAASVTWTRKETGQHGYDRHREIRKVDEARRKELLDEYCGAASRVEVLGARPKDFEDLSAPLQVACETRVSETGFDESADSFKYAWSGLSWVDPLPDLSAPTRVHPVVLSFAHADILKLDVKAPAGWKPRGSLDPVGIKTAWGIYRLEVKGTDSGYHVERSIAFLPIRIEAASYAPFLQFLNDVRRADRTPLEFLREAEAP